VRLRRAKGSPGSLAALSLLPAGCAQQVAQFRDPRTGIIVEECLRDPVDWCGVFADIDQGNQFAVCKTQAEARGFERVLNGFAPLSPVLPIQRGFGRSTKRMLSFRRSSALGVWA
jgi:hypothetical protein